MKKLILIVILFFVVAININAQNNIDLGKIQLPVEIEHRLEILPQGEYHLFLHDQEDPSLDLVRRDEDGFERSYGMKTKIENLNESNEKPGTTIDVVTVEGDRYVRFRVIHNRSVYTALKRCAADSIEVYSETAVGSQIDPKIRGEIFLIREAHRLLKEFSRTIWPDWQSWEKLDFIVTFPNGTRLAITQKARLPRPFQLLVNETIDGKKIYLDRTSEIPGKISQLMSIQGHGDFSGVIVNLTGPLKAEESIFKQTERKQTAIANSANEEDSLDAMCLNRLFTYIHEAFHVQQMAFLLESQMSGRFKKRGRMSMSFDPSLEYGFFADLEGKALLRAYLEKDSIQALEYFKDSRIARELKQAAMPPEAILADLQRTRDEGTATYSNLKMALLARASGTVNEIAQQIPELAPAYRRLDTYILNEGLEQLKNICEQTLDTYKKYYIYGTFQCLLLDRFLPGWKKDLFVEDSTLDDVIRDFLKLTDADKHRIGERLKTDFDYEVIMTKHKKSIQNRDEVVSSIINRKGRTFLIDLERAQSNFDINPRESWVYWRRQQLYPHGLLGFVHGGLRLVSEDTPMRLYGNILEWIDTDETKGENGYELKYETKDGDLYKNITLTTRGFRMTAKGAAVLEEGSTVKIMIID
jgi:hypothetical protein